jgi:hypothetical protein
VQPGGWGERPYGGGQPDPQSSQPPQGGYSWGGAPEFPAPRKNKTPWIVAAIAAAIAVIAVVAAVVMNGSGGSHSSQPSAQSSATPGAPATESAPDGAATYSIEGTIKAPLRVMYHGSDGKEVLLDVSSLPWSVVVSPAPTFISMFAIDSDMPETITQTVKLGDKVLRQCQGSGVCIGHRK